MRLSVWIFAAFSTLTAASASADEFAAARDAIEQGNYVAAVATLETLAEKDDAGSLALLASLYQIGKGVPKDIERAIELYKRAAELGHPEAQFNLGNIYLLGEGVKADEAWALTYYRQAASQGHELAARNMSQLYRAAGLEPPTFPAAATATPAPEDLARQEAEPEVTAAPPVVEVPLAPTTRIGEAGQQSSVEVAENARLTAPAEDIPTAPADPVVASSPGVESAASPAAEVSADEIEALRLAQAHGVEVSIDPDDAVVRAGRAVDPDGQALEDAMSAIAREDFDSGLEGISALAEQSYGPAEYELSRLYLAGHGVEQDTAAAMRWLHRAAENGQSAAQFDLGNRYLIGAGVEPDDAMAITLFRNAARAGHQTARERLAGLYADAGLPMPDLQRPSMPVAPSVEPVRTAAAESAAVIEEVFEPAPAAPVAEAAPDTPVPPTAPYEYAVIVHEDEAVPSASIDEINPPKPEDHEVVAGGELAQQRLPLIAATPADEPAPIEAGTDSILDENADIVLAAAPDVEELPPLVNEIAAASEVKTVERDPIAEPFVPARMDELDDEVEPPADLPIAAAATIGGVMGAASGAAASVDGSTVTKEQRGFLGRLKDALVAADSGPITSRAPGAASNIPASPKEAAQDDEDLKLVIADQAEPDPIFEMPTIDSAKQALTQGDFKHAAEMFHALAEDGDAEAQAHIGYMTYQGEGVKRDKTKAVSWYRRSAVQGNRDAQYNLAVSYAFGEGVAQDDGEAAVWYRRAAEQGSTISQYSLGVSYALGEGLEQSDTDAAKWYLAAAAQGYPAAQYNIAYMYRAGKGLPQDDTEALKWFLEAARNGHSSAQYSLGYMYRAGKGVQRDIDEAVRWYRMAADQGHPEARADLVTLTPDG